MTQAPNGTTVETTLHTVTLKANTLDLAGKSILIEGSGSLAANGNTKTVKVKLGSTVLASFSAALNNKKYHYRLRVCFVSSVLQTVSGFIGTDDNTNAPVKAVNLITPAEDLKTALAVLSTGQSDTASSDVLEDFFRVELHD